MLRPHLAYLQVKDAVADDRRSRSGRRRRRPGGATLQALARRRLHRLRVPRAAPRRRPRARRILRTRRVRRGSARLPHDRRRRGRRAPLTRTHRTRREEYDRHGSPRHHRTRRTGRHVRDIHRGGPRTRHDDRRDRRHRSCQARPRADPIPGGAGLRRPSRDDRHQATWMRSSRAFRTTCTPRWP